MDVYSYGGNIVNTDNLHMNGKCSIKWSFCDGMEHVQLVCYKTRDMSIVNSDRWEVGRILVDHLHLFIPIVHSDEFAQFQKNIVTLRMLRIVNKELQKYTFDIRHSY